MRKWIAAAALAFAWRPPASAYRPAERARCLILATMRSLLFGCRKTKAFTCRWIQSMTVSLRRTVWEETGLEADRFYQFDTGEEGFLRTGELFLQADEDQQVYEIAEDGSIDEVEAKYAHGYTIGKDGERSAAM